jgi:xanthine dehydrogenase/oxidase
MSFLHKSYFVVMVLGDVLMRVCVPLEYMQIYVASTLGVPMHKLVCKTKRIGGGFGGKETRSIFIHCAAAVPAYHLRRPVKAILDRDEDMQMTGGQPFLRSYLVC